MATISIYTNNGYADGTIGVFIRIVHKRKSAKKQLFKIEPQYWNGKRVNNSHPHSTTLNKTLSETIYRLNELIYTFDREGRLYTARELLDYKGGEALLADIFHEYMATKPHTTQRKYQNVLDHLEKWRPGSMISEVNISYIDRFKAYLLSHPRIKSDTTVSKYLKFLKAVLNYQYKLGNFDDRMVLSYPTPTTSGRQKDALTREEFERFRNADICHLSRDIFAFCVYLNGTRIGDALQLRPDQIKGDRIEFRMQKNGKTQSIRLIEPAYEIIERWKGKSEWYIFPRLKRRPMNARKNKNFYDYVKSATALVNRDLKLLAKFCQIDKNISTHVARNTFALWADEKGISSRDIQHLLKHGDLKTTEAYLRKVREQSRLDDAQGKVFE